MIFGYAGFSTLEESIGCAGMEPARRQVDKRGRGARRAILGVGLMAVACLFPGSAAGTRTTFQGAEGEARAFTDGHLRPGHLEAIRIKGFPGRGSTKVAFFPTAICGSGCAGATRRGAKTSKDGAAKFAVRIPGTFVGHDGKHVYFRDGEQIDLQVLWFGSSKAFGVADADPEPIMVRTHGSKDG